MNGWCHTTIACPRRSQRHFRFAQMLRSAGAVPADRERWLNCHYPRGHGQYTLCRHCLWTCPHTEMSVLIWPSSSPAGATHTVGWSECPQGFYVVAPGWVDPQGCNPAAILADLASVASHEHLNTWLQCDATSGPLLGHFHAFRSLLFIY